MSDNNLKYIESKDRVSFEIDTKLFPAEVVYQTAYVFTSKAYVSLDGDPEDVLVVNLRWKEVDDPVKEIRGEFENELLNQTVRGIVNVKNAATKEAIVSRALVTASGSTEFDDILNDLNDIEDIDIDAELSELEKELN